MTCRRYDGGNFSVMTQTRGQGDLVTFQIFCVLLTGIPTADSSRCLWPVQAGFLPGGRPEGVERATRLRAYIRRACSRCKKSQGGLFTGECAKRWSGTFCASGMSSEFRCHPGEADLEPVPDRQSGCPHRATGRRQVHIIREKMPVLAGNTA